ncbi:glycoside hydrolase family 15 protein [Natronolimnobius sp. AArcel1]|uniref:glycoside hydrolase family 15 protein n=1 Tax=Natronolimnobius sp. AArcel1 TaxID=1679093 RepID=UPI0013E9B376|nr:glycoside hydrolase family 15 protein [Natronolimnobius sp. AArcel1]NGM68258.1 glycoside hydrolase family 15 protein [Natronolimnobius sp. AArcel1]
MDDDYIPIEAYGVIGNNDRCALVGNNGSVDWCCFPHLESPSVFAAILDADDGGRFAIRPTKEYDTTQTYVDRTNVLETTFETDSGSARVTDFMPVRGDEEHDIATEQNARRDDSEPELDDDAETRSSDNRFQQAIYRTIEGVAGTVDLEVVFEPRFDYARSTTTLEHGETGEVRAAEANEAENHSVNGDVTDDQRPADEQRHQSDEQGHLSLRTDTDLEFAIDDAETVATAPLTVTEDEQCWFHLQYGDPEHTLETDYQQCLEETITYWQTWLESCEEAATDIFTFRDDWHDALVRSTLVLKLLIHDETGSIPAAATTSLPEEIGGELNWDYRYNWIRDAKFTIQALHSVGQSQEAHEYFEWFREIGHESPEDIRPLYGLHGETDLEEEFLEHLSGYRDSQPVRIGNAAADQVQLDMYGTIVQGIYETIRYEDGLSEYDWESVCALANHVCDHWEERGKGIWEFRDLEEHFVHSKLLCWVALDRAIRLGGEYDYDGPFTKWDREREAIREAIEARGYNEEKGSFMQFFGAEDALDATALLIPLYDFLPADDERVQNTIDTILEEAATDDGLVFRFTDSPARPTESGGFVLCSCWLVDALVLSGRIEEATDIFENLLEYASPLGLLSEMIHAEDGTLLGNFPQAFSHIGLLNSAIYLASADDAEQLPPEELAGGAAAPLFTQHGPDAESNDG